MSWTGREIAPQTKSPTPRSARRCAFSAEVSDPTGSSVSAATFPESISRKRIWPATSKTGAIRPFQVASAAFITSGAHEPYRSRRPGDFIGNDILQLWLRNGWEDR